MQCHALNFNTLQRCDAMQCRTTQCDAMQSKPIECNSVICNARKSYNYQCNTKQHNTKRTTYHLLQAIRNEEGGLVRVHRLPALEHVVTDVQTDVVGQVQRAHRVTGAELREVSDEEGDNSRSDDATQHNIHHTTQSQL
jgi:hypothetical protein